MKLQVTQANLNRALSTVGRVAGGRTSLPVLSNVLLSTDGNQLKLAATNLEIAITQHIGAKVETQGSITVPARLMSDFVSSLPDSNINLEVVENKLVISTENYNSTINGVVADEFPSIPTVEAQKPLTFTGAELKGAISQVLVAASNDEARPVLTGVYLYNFEGSLYFVATDSYRLAERKFASYDQDLAMIIPSKSLSEVQRIINDDTNVEFHFDDSQIMVKFDETELVSKLIDGKFPTYRQLIPDQSEVTFTIARNELTSITKVAALFARESAGSITLEVSSEQQTVSIASVASQVGKNTSQASAKVSGDGSVTLNSRFLLDALNAVNDPVITFRFSGNTNPCIVQPTGKEKELYKHIVMPLKA